MRALVLGVKMLMPVAPANDDSVASSELILTALSEAINDGRIFVL